MKKTLAILTSLLVCVAMLAAGCGGKKETEKYPTKAITVICPWGAGGGTDTILRALAKASEKEFGQTVTVSNVTGGGGSTGHAAIMNAKKDGYNIGMITFELNSLPPQGLAPFTYKDFDPVMLVNTDAAALTVNADAPYKTLEEFIAYAKAHPDEISIGNSAPGSVWHIAAGLMAQKTGIKVKHVPFEGGAPAVTALVGNHIQAVSVSVAEVQSQVKAGKLRILGVMDDKRDGLFPEVKTFKEQGVDVVFGTWRGIALPKGTPANVKTKVEEAFSKAMKDPEFVATAKKMGLTLNYKNSTDFAKFLADNAEMVDKTMDSIGLKKKK